MLLVLTIPNIANTLQVVLRPQRFFRLRVAQLAEFLSSLLLFLNLNTNSTQATRTLPFYCKIFSWPPLSAHSTPPSTHRTRTIRRQSSVGAYQDTTTTTNTHHQQQQQQPQHSSVPISSSTSYYTNSPSPPHAGEPPPPADEQLVDTTTVTTNLAQCFQHSTQAAATLVDGTQQHSDNLVISRNQFESMTCKLDHLTRRVQQLEQTLQTDVRMILAMLQQQQPPQPHPQGKEVALIRSEVSVLLTILFKLSFSAKPNHLNRSQLSSQNYIATL